MGIRENAEKVKKGIREAAEKAGRDPEDILLLYVTKLHSPDEMNEAIRAGATDIGENKVQEIVNKYDDVLPVKWHLIGHLQTNKVKYIIDKVSMIQSVDSEKLAKEIEKRASAAGLTMDILVQLDPMHQETKFGMDPEELEGFLSFVAGECPNIRVKGLMGIAPMSEDPEDARPFFREMKKIFDETASGELAKSSDAIDMRYLSLGMTNDYKVAIEEGSNLVRVGTAIFGRRDYRSEEK